MAKRFTDSEKWADPWFCEITERDRGFWMYLLDNCNHAGFWKVNWILVDMFFPGYRPDLSIFNGRIKVINEGKWFLPKYIEFQYGKLNPDSRIHASVISVLEKERVNEELLNSLLTLPSRVMDKDKDKVITNKRISVFEDEKLDRTFNAFVEMRKKIKAPMTEHAMNLVINKLKDYSIETAVKMLEQSIERSWRGVFEVQGDHGGIPEDYFRKKQMARKY